MPTAVGRWRAFNWALGPLAFGLMTLLAAELGIPVYRFGPVLVAALVLSSVVGMVVSVVPVSKGGAGQSIGLVGLVSNGMVVIALIIASG